MTRCQKRVWTMLAILLLFSLLFSLSGTAFAHHAGLNPGVGNINEAMVHNGLMERAADMGFWNQPWVFEDPPVP